MQNILKFIALIALLIFASCRDDFDFEPSNGTLQFSKDTVYLDTVFTNIGSSTYTLKVYNRSDKDIKIPTLGLEKGQTSKYRITVDGMTGNNNKSFENIELLANDSLFIFIETTINYNDFTNPNSSYLYTDRILFDAGAKQQDVDLVTLVQDAVFLYPQKDNQGNIEQVTLGLDAQGNPVTLENAFELSETDPVNGNELVWTKQKPYIIYGNAVVPTSKTLTVEKGARVHFHSESNLFVNVGATLHINGELSTTDALENEVIFEGDRLEPGFADVSGQWGAVVLFSGNANAINHLTLKNAVAGLVLQPIATNVTPNVTIQNSQIYNCSNLGILARASTINAQNVVINRAGQAALACTYGGTYNFTHCTLANYWNRPNQFPLLLNNYLQVSQTQFDDSTTNATFTNCIFYGSSNYGISIDKKGTSNLNYYFNNCLIKFFDSGNLSGNTFYVFTDASKYNNCKIATTTNTFNPKFIDGYQNKLQLGVGGVETISGVSTTVMQDILGISRTGTINLGAYQYVP